MSHSAAAPAPRFPTDPVALAIAALANLPLTPERRLVEVGRLSAVLHQRAEIDRAAGIDEDEVEAGCRVAGELEARMVRMHLAAPTAAALSEA